MGDEQNCVGTWAPQKQAEELKKRMGIMFGQMEDGIKQLATFQPAQDDVIVAMPPKNGTTWLTHICHQIRTRGREPDFQNQLEVLYMLEMSEKITGVKPEHCQQPESPRLYATHMPYHLLPTGGKLIFSFRDQKDALISAYHFFDSQFILKGRVSLLVFGRIYLTEVEKHINDLMVWWEHRHDPNVFLLFFDTLKEDHSGAVRQLAKFMGVDCDEDAIARVVHSTSHSEMLRHGSKFDVRNMALMMAKKLGEELTPEYVFVGRIRKSGGKSGQGKEQLPPDIQQSIDQLWQEIVTTKLGFKDLNEMREAWKKEQCS